MKSIPVTIYSIYTVTPMTSVSNIMVSSSPISLVDVSSFQAPVTLIFFSLLILHTYIQEFHHKVACKCIYSFAQME